MNTIIKYIILPVMALTMALHVPAQRKPDSDPYDLIEDALNSLQFYRFSNARDYLNQFKRLPEKSKENLLDEYEQLNNELILAENALERVEKIVVIDSVSVRPENFFEAFRLPSSAGRIVSGSSLMFVPDMEEDAVAHVNEAGDYILWSALDDDDELFIRESMKLLDGTWLTREIEIDSDLIDEMGYPFVSQDGQTIYFSGRGQGSMGRNDIFVVQRDPITGEFLNPLNIGMPFNSPCDDLMMVLDEENGIGWWATDRWGDFITVYAYILNDVRQNYPEDTDDIESFAMINDYRATWPAGMQSKIQALLKALPKNETTPQAKAHKFDFPISNGVVYHNYSDFKNPKAADAMKKYLDRKEELDKEKAALKELRRYYSGNKKNLAAQIQKAEENVESLSLEVDSLRKRVYQLEKSKR